MNLLSEIFLGEEKIFSRKVLIFHATLILTSILFVMIFSYSTSPLYNLLGGDSALFQVVGKYWYEGYLPYVNVFDHKGSLIFFINMVGYAIHPRTGMIVLQTISLYLSCLLVWRAISLYSSSPWKIFFLIVMLIFYAAHYEEGNHVEEYTVLFLSAATYCFLRSLKENTFPPLCGFVYGLGLGACLLIRLSDAAQICCQIFLTAIFLLQNKEFKILQQNFLSLCAGFMIIVLPCVIYFAAHGILYDMLYGTILYNLKYTGVSSFTLPPKYSKIYKLFHLLPIYTMIIVAIISLKQNHSNKLSQSVLFIGIAMLSLLISFRTYLHYMMLFFPISPFLFVILSDNNVHLQKIWNSPKFSLKRVLIKILIFFAVIHLCTLVFFLKIFLMREKNSVYFLFPAYGFYEEFTNSNEQKNISDLAKFIPENERESFVCWGAWNTGAHWILRTNMKPRERFFMNNGLLMKIDPKIREEFFSNLRRNYPLWIIYGTTLNRKISEPPKSLNEDEEFEHLLAEKYSLKGEVYIFPQMMKLYRLKD